MSIEISAMRPKRLTRPRTMRTRTGGRADPKFFFSEQCAALALHGSELAEAIGRQIFVSYDSADV